MSKKNNKAPKSVKIDNHNISLSSQVSDKSARRTMSEKEKLKTGDLVCVDMTTKFGVKTIQIMPKEKAIKNGYIILHK